MKNIINIIYIFIFFKSFKCDYAIFELDTYKNNSQYDKEQINYFYNTLNNSLYSKIFLGPKNIQYIMEFKIDTIGFTIYNFNCDIPPLNSEANSPLLPNFANSKIIDHVDDNETEIFGEYFIYILENNINIKTEKGEKNLNIDYLFSQRNDTNYVKKDILRPYTCFNLGFHLPTKEILEDEYASNLIIQLKKQKVINSYNWFIEYDSNNREKAKLILGAKPYEYNKDKYKEENDKTIQAETRLDKKIYWDLKMDEIYLMENKSKKISPDHSAVTCSLEPSLGVIIGANGYRTYIEDALFKDFITIKKCFKDTSIYKKFVIYYCDKDMKDTLQKKESAKLYFKHRFFGKIFELNFEDLFEEKGNFIFFKIFFDEKDEYMWRLGKPFLVKYFFSFNFEGKTISFYDIGENKDVNDKLLSNKTILIILIVIILGIVFLIVGYFFGKYIFICKKKNKKAEELIENENIDNININEG